MCLDCKTRLCDKCASSNTNLASSVDITPNHGQQLSIGGEISLTGVSIVKFKIDPWLRWLHNPPEPNYEMTPSIRRAIRKHIESGVDVHPSSIRAIALNSDVPLMEAALRAFGTDALMYLSGVYDSRLRDGAVPVPTLEWLILHQTIVSLGALGHIQREEVLDSVLWNTSNSGHTHSQDDMVIRILEYFPRRNIISSPLSASRFLTYDNTIIIDWVLRSRVRHLKRRPHNRTPYEFLLLEMTRFIPETWGEVVYLALSSIPLEQAIRLSERILTFTSPTRRRSVFVAIAKVIGATNLLPILDDLIQANNLRYVISTDVFSLTAGLIASDTLSWENRRLLAWFIQRGTHAVINPVFYDLEIDALAQNPDNEKAVALSAYITRQVRYELELHEDANPIAFMNKV